MKVDAVRDREVMLQFIERNVSVAPRDLDEGIGTVYERVVIDDYLRQLQTTRDIHTVLENPADGVTGVPGLMSLEFARNGGEVWLANPSQNMLDGARSVWEREGLVNRGHFTKCEVDGTPFDNDSFDLVWNYCMFERFGDPAPLVAEMKRVSKRYVMLMTQNVFNLGTVFHKIYHAMEHQDWDHGHDGQMTMPAIRRALRQQGMHIELEGTVDVPPWLDTWDMPLRGELKQLLAHIGARWQWRMEPTSVSESSSARTKNSVPRTIGFVREVENSLPTWFRLFQAHHLYILARK
jgi:SAM-dependent methyltransferase